MICYIVIVNRAVELEIDKLELVWSDHYEYGKRVGIITKLFLNKNYNPKEDGSLDVIIYDDLPGFTIKGSLRKAFFGKRNATADLSREQFAMCISIIADQPKVSKAEIWYSDFTFLEFGANIVMPARYKGVFNCISTFQRRKKNEYQDETLYLKNGSKETKLYDKLLEIFKKGGMSKKTYNKLSKVLFILRYEVRLKPQTIKKFSGNQLIDIYNNWNAYVDYWLSDYRKISFENKLPIKSDTIEGMIGLKEIKNYFISQAIHNLGGLAEAKKIVYSTDSKRKSEFFNELKKAYRPNMNKEYQRYIKVLNTKVEAKAKSKIKL